MFRYRSRGLGAWTWGTACPPVGGLPKIPPCRLVETLPAARHGDGAAGSRRQLREVFIWSNATRYARAFTR
jgi:hypothetical protein